MRQRKPKDLEKRIDECGEFLVRDPKPEAWENCFDAGEDTGRKLYVEIGCGKGDFIVAKAMDDPANDYLGIEGQESVLLRALEKATWLAGSMSPAGGAAGGASAAGSGLTRPLGNLRFAGVYVRSMKDLFDEGSLDGIFLNFSDPWPKKRHYKRRLTWRGRLKEYAWALRSGGSIEIKTDNDDLFDFTLEEVEAMGWTPDVMTRDLHGTDIEARLTMTEYEKKYHKAGKSINYLKVTP